MNIESSSIRVASQQASSRYFAIEETLHAWVGTPRPTFEAQTDQARTASRVNAAKDTVSAVVAQRKPHTPYPGYVATPLASKNSDHALQGSARSSRAYLISGDAAGVAQQIDLVV
jgi:hypothetical protein